MAGVWDMADVCDMASISSKLRDNVDTPSMEMLVVDGSDRSEV